ncbi:MAG: bifunctional (p)ppGpp synthetase/guanosine-3',5'-bis(diphosphate) 3'-pyrophosphohydrolase, partial [Pseudomonadota bacterium]|nr:bifunctional (p)ppGpp synthetase/guanosine-3',5'-bis(diphosphate) 3'-pyrophosphohydrolase [Pseudomonadota bacterium]
SMKAHGTQQRASGDPYFSHPVEVAGILSEKKLDTASIVTGLLHDTVEDTVATLDDIERLFGDEISRLVDGVTKLGQLELQSDQTKQAENFRKLLLAMSGDIRVLLVKLADRLHNMRTLSYIPKPEKRARIARETMDIYAPLAERIGIRDWKDELEDLAFTELNADARDSILNRLGFLREQGEDLVGQVVNELEQTLAAKGVKARVLGREKKAYSIWRKMQRRDVVFGQLSDIVAFRIIVDNIEDCYRTLGIIHNRYQVVPGRFKDYISIPKPNGYSSIHTGVMGPQMQRVEVQIRTQSMHEIAELGVAAHWQYKQGDSDPVKEGTQYRWLRELLEILEHAAEPEEFLEHTKLEMFADQVFCFTPKGDLFAMPFGATPVDFAYAVHTDVGNTCVAAKINGRIMPLRTRLKNGDQVEITTSKAQTPSPAWEAFVATGKARACIRRFIRSQRLEQYESLGREIVEKAFSRDGYELTRKAIKGVLKKLDAENEVELYAAVGEGQTTGRDVLEAVYPGAKRRDNQKNIFSLEEARPKQKKKSHAIPIKGLIPGMAVHFAGCCHPLPGDRIVGIVTTGKGV